MDSVCVPPVVDEVSVEYMSVCAVTVCDFMSDVDVCVVWSVVSDVEVLFVTCEV